MGADMLFIHPMWFSESQRIGNQKCSPTGYRLHVIADLIGFLGLLLLFVVPAVLVSEWVSGTFHGSHFWLFAVPFGLGMVSELLFQYSWWLTLRKGFHYDYERDEASWMEAGGRRTYNHRA
jgi:hypothetical protein